MTTGAVDEPLYIEGPIASAQEDAEGNTFAPEDMDTDEFLASGFLDIDHLHHKYRIAESVVGKPVAVWRKGKQLFGRFVLSPTQIGRDIYEYVKAHPGVLGFSIAGDLEKPWFGRGGRWIVKSCAITHVPMNADTGAFALSAGSTMTLRGVMTAFTNDLLHGAVDTRSLSSMYVYFKGMAGPVLGLELAAWAYKEIHLRMDYGLAAVDLMTQLRNTLMVPEEDAAAYALDTKAHLAQWKLLHPDDVHLNRTGQFQSLEDAVAHFRYCERLNPIQVATLLGRIRGTDLIRGSARQAS